MPNMTASRQTVTTKPRRIFLTLKKDLTLLKIPALDALGVSWAFSASAMITVAADAIY